MPVILRSAAKLQRIASGNPYLARGDSAEQLHVGFLQTTPTQEQLDKLDPARSPPDSFAVCENDIWLQFINGTAKTKLSTTYFDRTLKTVMTVRNWPHRARARGDGWLR